MNTSEQQYTVYCSSDCKLVQLNMINVSNDLNVTSRAASGFLTPTWDFWSAIHCHGDALCIICSSSNME